MIERINRNYLFISIIFSFFIVILLNLFFKDQTDYMSYIEYFERIKNGDFKGEIDFYRAFRSNSALNWIWVKAFAYLGISNAKFLADLLYFFQAFIHSYIVFNLVGLNFGFLFLFSDLQQIEFNQLRYGVSLSFLTISSLILHYPNKISYFFPKIFILKKINRLFLGSILGILGLIFHFQSIFIAIITPLYKIKTKSSIFLSVILLSFFPIFVTISNITKRYINAPLVERVYPLNLILYIPTVTLIILWLTSLEDNRILSFKIDNFKFLIGLKHFSRYIIPISILIIGFFQISENPVYQGRIITGLYSTLMFITPIKLYIAFKSKGEVIKMPTLIIALLILIGIYRFITLWGNVWSLIS